MPYRDSSSHHHIDYFLFGAAFILQQAHGLLHGLGTAASGILAVAAVVRAVTEFVKICRSARRALPEGTPPFRSFCPFAAICRGGAGGRPIPTGSTPRTTNTT